MLLKRVLQQQHMMPLLPIALLGQRMNLQSLDGNFAWEK